MRIFYFSFFPELLVLVHDLLVLIRVPTISKRVLLFCELSAKASGWKRNGFTGGFLFSGTRALAGRGGGVLSRLQGVVLARELWRPVCGLDSGSEKGVEGRQGLGPPGVKKKTICRRRASGFRAPRRRASGFRAHQGEKKQ